MADVIVDKLASGQHNVIYLTINDTRLVCNFPKESALVGKQDGDLLLSFSDNATVTLGNFYVVFSQHNMPEFLMKGHAISGKAFFSELPHRLLPSAPRPLASSNVVLPEQDSLETKHGKDFSLEYDIFEEDVIPFLPNPIPYDASQDVFPNEFHEEAHEAGDNLQATQYTLRAVRCTVIPPSARIYAPYRMSYLTAPDVVTHTSVLGASYTSAMLAFLATFPDTPEMIEELYQESHIIGQHTPNVYVDMAPLAENFEDFPSTPDYEYEGDIISNMGEQDVLFTDNLFTETPFLDDAVGFVWGAHDDTRFVENVDSSVLFENKINDTFTYDTSDALIDGGVGMDMIQSVMTNMGNIVTKFVAKTVNGVEIVVFGNKISGDTVEATLQQIGGIKTTDNTLEVDADFGWQQTATYDYNGSRYAEFSYDAKPSGASDDDITILVAQNVLALGA